MADPVLLAVGGEAEALLVRAVDDSAGRLAVTRRCADLSDLLAAASAGLGRVAVAATDLPGLDRDGVDALHREGVLVVVVSHRRAEHGRRELGLGADRVVLLPHDESQARAVVDDVVAALRRRVPAPPTVAAPAGPPPPEGGMVAVWGPTGAPGRSTLAVNLAAELAAAHGTATLVDADTYGGCLAQLVGALDEAPGLAAAVRAAATGRLDLPVLAALAPVLAPGLRLLSGIARADRWPELGAASLDVVWSQARRLTRWVVVDTGFCLETDEALSYDTTAPARNAATLSALTAADLVVVVGSGDPVGMARLVRALGELDDAGLALTRLVVVNRVRASVAGPAPAQAVRAALSRYAGVGSVHVVPDDPASFDLAMREGRALAEVAAGSPARRAVVDLAARVTLASRPAAPL